MDDDMPTRAEADRDAAEALCATRGHIVTEIDEDGTIGCDRCGETALDTDEPADPALEPTPTEDQRQEWAAQDVERIRRSDLGAHAA